MQLPTKAWYLILSLFAALPACSDRDSDKGSGDGGSDPDRELVEEKKDVKSDPSKQETRLEPEPDKTIEEPDEGIGPKPRAEKESLLGKARSVDDLRVTRLKLKADMLLECMRWSPDGNHFYLLSREGMLRKIAYPSLEQEHVLEIGLPTGAMQMSQLGLLVGIKEPGQIWLIDGMNLAVRKKLDVPHPDLFEFTSSPSSTAVYVSDSEEDRMVIIDLKTGSTLKTFYGRDLNDKYEEQIKKHPDSGALSDMSLPAISPDGQHIFCESSNCLHRLKVSGDDLIYEEMGPRIGSNSTRIYFSQDSRYVAMPAGAGNRRPEGYPETGPYANYVYRTSDLTHPAMTIDAGAYPGCIAFDPSGERVYVHNSDYQLMIFSPEGDQEQAYVLTKKGAVVRQFLVHPTGGSLLVLTVLDLIKVQFSGDQEGAESSAAPSTETFQQRLVANSWLVRRPEGDSYTVKFGENGLVTRHPENKRWWKWRITNETCGS